MIPTRLTHGQNILATDTFLYLPHSYHKRMENRWRNHRIVTSVSRFLFMVKVRVAAKLPVAQLIIQGFNLDIFRTLIKTNREKIQKLNLLLFVKRKQRVMKNKKETYILFFFVIFLCFYQDFWQVSVHLQNLQFMLYTGYRESYHPANCSNSWKP